MLVKPASKEGRVAGWLGLAVVLWVFVVGPLLDVAWKGADPSLGPVNLTGVVAFALALAATVVALVALLRRKDRALVVWLALVPIAFVLVFELAERLLGAPA